MAKKILELKDLYKSFGGVKAVQGVSFDVIEGEILGLIGPNGSGKSTVVNLITGVYELDSGTVIFDGQEIPEKNPFLIEPSAEWRRTFRLRNPFQTSRFLKMFTSSVCKRCQKAESKPEQEMFWKHSSWTDIRTTMGSQLPIERRKWLDLAKLLLTDRSSL